MLALKTQVTEESPNFQINTAITQDYFYDTKFYRA